MTWLNPEITVADIPLFKVVLAIVIITLAQILRKLFSAVIIKYIEDATNQTATELDDELIAILKKPLNWLIVLGGIWTAKLILLGELDPNINQAGDSLIKLTATIVVAWIIFRASPLLGKVLSKLVLNTETELDNLIVPYIPKVFQALVITIVPSTVAL